MNNEEWKKLADILFCTWLKFESDLYDYSFYSGKYGITAMLSNNSNCVFKETIMRYEDKEVIEFKRNKIIETFRYYSDMENEELDNLVLHEEKESEIMSVAERDVKSTTEII